MRGFIDDRGIPRDRPHHGRSQSAFVRGFIDDDDMRPPVDYYVVSQSAFVRGFIDDSNASKEARAFRESLNPRSCAASSMT